MGLACQKEEIYLLIKYISEVRGENRNVNGIVNSALSKQTHKLRQKNQTGVDLKPHHQGKLDGSRSIPF